MIIALESASTDPSLALVEVNGAPIAVDGWTSDGRQASDLLPRLLALLAREGRALEQATAVAVGTGPGSFTGLRVGMSLAKGLAFGLGVPIVGVPSLAAWLADELAAVAAVARAGAHDAYLLQRGEATPTIIGSQDLARRIGPALVVAPTEVAGAFGIPLWQPPLRAALAIGEQASQRLATDPHGDDLESLEPGYLRQPRGIASPATGSPPWP
ncbi:MAG: tRNA (adenosine(37)-N6)-threonylcarbamoyltransferase complex dimerization subunit type 1 TsaB [Candidatus Limnocylindria bacterium]